MISHPEFSNAFSDTRAVRGLTWIGTWSKGPRPPKEHVGQAASWEFGMTLFQTIRPKGSQAQPSTRLQPTALSFAVALPGACSDVVLALQALCCLWASIQPGESQSWHLHNASYLVREMCLLPSNTALRTVFVTYLPSSQCWGAWPAACSLDHQEQGGDGPVVAQRTMNVGCQLD